ncbi:MAG: ABC transporter permease, partial [Burkholderiales bacterium]|nr:ABC transporter permease [Burkholderiales bacterium]
MIALEPRPEPSRAMAWLSPVIALAITVVVAAALFVALGRDPVAGLRVFLWEPLNGARALSEVALKSTPLVLCGRGRARCGRARGGDSGAAGPCLRGARAGGGGA